MKVYFQSFANFEQNNWAQLLLIAEFTYNNAKNINSNHTFFELVDIIFTFSIKKTSIFNQN